MHLAGSHAIVLDVYRQSELLLESQVRNSQRARSFSLEILTSRDTFPLQPFLGTLQTLPGTLLNPRRQSVIRGVVELRGSHKFKPRCDTQTFLLVWFCYLHQMLLANMKISY